MEILLFFSNAILFPVTTFQKVSKKSIIFFSFSGNAVMLKSNASCNALHFSNCNIMDNNALNYEGLEFTRVCVMIEFSSKGVQTMFLAYIGGLF